MDVLHIVHLSPLCIYTSQICYFLAMQIKNYFFSQFSTMQIHRYLYLCIPQIYFHWYPKQDIPSLTYLSNCCRMAMFQIHGHFLWVKALNLHNYQKALTNFSAILLKQVSLCPYCMNIFSISYLFVFYCSNKDLLQIRHNLKIFNIFHLSFIIHFFVKFEEFFLFDL